MSNAREEVEQFLRSELVETEHIFYTYAHWQGFISRIAQSILDKLPELGFVRLDDVEIDEEKLRNFLFDYAYGTPTKYTIDDVKVAHAIAEAKGILRVKEAKND